MKNWNVFARIALLEQQVQNSPTTSTSCQYRHLPLRTEP